MSPRWVRGVTAAESTSAPGSGSKAMTEPSRWYRLVGPDEFDMASDYISMDSPLGSSLLGKRLDDAVTVALPAGDQTFTVIAISYGPRP